MRPAQGGRLGRRRRDPQAAGLVDLVADALARSPKLEELAGRVADSGGGRWTRRRADQLLWLVTGTDKRDALGRLLGGDDTIPAGRVEARASLVIADDAAALSGERT